jgi:hypothetical protein
MATNTWEGGAAAVAQVDTVTPANVEVGDIFTITINGKSVSFTATEATVSNVTAGIVALFNASEEPEFAEITAADATTHVTLTADTAGVPFTATASATNGGAADTQTFTRAESVANSGPNDANVASNWSTGSVPAGGDDLVFENSAVDCLYHLESLGNESSLTIKRSYTGKIGLPRSNANGYVEYRPTALALGTAITSIDIGQGDGSGSSRINLAIGNLSAGLTINVHYTAGRVLTGVPPILITTGTQSDDTTLVVNRGDVGVAFHTGDTAVIDILEVGYVTSQTVDAKVTLGSGVSPLTTVTKSGGILYCDSAIVTLVNHAGTVYLGGSATVTTATVNEGTLYYNSSGTATTINVAGLGTLDFRQDSRDRTVTNATIHKGGKIYDPSKTVTWTNGIDVYYCGLSDVTLDLGDHLTVTPSAV